MRCRKGKLNMRIIVLDDDRERMNENFAYFTSHNDVIFLAAKNVAQLCELAAFADAAAVYLTDTLADENIPPLNIACYFICEEATIGVKLKCFASGAECIEGMPKEQELCRHILSNRSAIEKRISHSNENISRILELCGINEKHKGYDYIKTSLDLCCRDPDFLNNITKQLYPEVARGFKTGAAAVERAIRNAVETSWSCGSEFYEVLFPEAKGKRPSNAAFLRTIVDKVGQDI